MATHAAPTTAAAGGRYFVPAPSAWPFILTFALVLVIIGVAGYLETKHWGPLPIYGGAALAIYIIFTWFRGVARESEGGAYSAQVDRTYRWGMSWFIFSEVMFFGAFFGALFYARGLSLPWLSGEGAKLATNLVLWPGFEAHWPSNGPANVGGEFETIPAFDVPLINTLILLSSGGTITVAHHMLKEGKRGACILWMWATVALGASFLAQHALVLALDHFAHVLRQVGLERLGVLGLGVVLAALHFLEHRDVVVAGRGLDLDPAAMRRTGQAAGVGGGVAAERAHQLLQLAGGLGAARRAIGEQGLELHVFRFLGGLLKSLLAVFGGADQVVEQLHRFVIDGHCLLLVSHASPCGRAAVGIRRRRASRGV